MPFLCLLYSLWLVSRVNLNRYTVQINELSCLILNTALRSQAHLDLSYMKYNLLENKDNSIFLATSEACPSNLFLFSMCFLIIHLQDIKIVH